MCLLLACFGGREHYRFGNEFHMIRKFLDFPFDVLGHFLEQAVALFVSRPAPTQVDQVDVETHVPANLECLVRLRHSVAVRVIAVIITSYMERHTHHVESEGASLAKKHGHISQICAKFFAECEGCIRVVHGQAKHALRLRVDLGNLMQFFHTAKVFGKQIN